VRKNAYFIVKSIHTGHWILDTGYSMLDTGNSILETRYWMLDAGCWSLVTGKNGSRLKVQGINSLLSLLG
jgi:hypothetical protein